MIPININITDAYAILRPLLLFVAGMVVYSLFIFHFYRFLARKDIFKLDLNQYNTSQHPTLKKIVHVFFYTIEYLILFPLFTFFWFAVLTSLLILLSKNQDIHNIIVVAIALVGAVRVTAYYNEDLSKDLAKMIPFALLGIFLVDISFFSIDSSLAVAKQIPDVFNSLIYYLFFIIVLEFVLRILYSIKILFNPEEEPVSKK